MMTRRQIIATGAALGLAGMARINTGFYVPAEESPHQATFMQWPNSRYVYDDADFMADTQQTIADIANAISDFEPVILLAAAQHHAHIRKMVSASVELWDIPTEDLWARDSGPLFANDGLGNQQIVSLNFNGWGNKQRHAFDGKIAQTVAEAVNLPFINSGLMGEAGGVEQDGHGLLMAHESSWVIKNRNKGSKADIEQKLLGAYGADRMIWAKGIKGQDITDYHIDSLARFTGPNRAIIQLPESADDLWSHAMWDTHDALKAAEVDLTIIAQPSQWRIQDNDFVAAYANYFVCNGAVICAEYGDKQADAAAVAALRAHYKGREIVTLNADTLGFLGGGIHCATQQWPTA